MDNNVLIILGIHRSGTSLTAQWIQKCGLSIGNNLMSGSSSNKDGHFEDLEMHDLHEKIFQKHNIPYGGFENIDNFELTDNDIDRIKKLITKKNKENGQWGWKDPRTCLFISHYLKIIPNACILLVLRDYNQIIDSLINRRIASKYENYKRHSLAKLKIFLFNTLRRGRTKRRLGKLYTNATILYLQNILKIFNYTNNIIPVFFNSITEDSHRILSNIEKNGFVLKNKIDIKTIIKPQYITAKKECNFITNRKILDQLQEQIHERLKTLGTSPN